MNPIEVFPEIVVGIEESEIFALVSLDEESS